MVKCLQLCAVNVIEYLIVCTIKYVYVTSVKYTVYMFGFGDLSHADVKYYAIFDLCSSSIGAGIAKKVGSKTKLLWQKRVYFGYNGSDDYDRYSRTMYATLLEVGMKMTGEGFKIAKNNDEMFSVKNLEIICVLSSPWFMNVVSNVVQKKEMPFNITKSVVNTMEKKARLTVDENPAVLSWMNVVGDYALLGTHKNKILVEGYMVDSVEHRKANELSIQFCVDLVPVNAQKHIEEVLMRVLPNHELFFVTSTQTFSNIESHDVCVKNDNLILLEIGGEVTSIAVLRGGTISGVSTIPSGVNHLLRTHSPGSSTVKEARDSLEIFLKKNTKIEQKVLTKKMQNLLNDWKSKVHLTIRNLTHGTTPPINFILVVDVLSYYLYKFELEKEWEMPGVRKSLKLNISHITPEVNNEKNNRITNDVRISTLVRLLCDCTNEKGVCYNIMNKV